MKTIHLLSLLFKISIMYYSLFIFIKISICFCIIIIFLLVLYIITCSTGWCAIATEVYMQTIHLLSCLMLYLFLFLYFYDCCTVYTIYSLNFLCCIYNNNHHLYISYFYIYSPNFPSQNYQKIILHMLWKEVKSTNQRKKKQKRKKLW